MRTLSVGNLGVVLECGDNDAGTTYLVEKDDQLYWLVVNEGDVWLEAATSAVEVARFFAHNRNERTKHKFERERRKWGEEQKRKAERASILALLSASVVRQ
jgi:hypothetical protein